MAQTIAQRALARRGEAYAGEVRRLLDAALDVMRANGTSARARVSDIVAAAGLSNDAFYRHFTSKDALVTALLEDGAVRLVGYLRHQMDKEPSPERKVRRWIQGVLSQTDSEIAAATRAVLWNSSSSGEGMASGRHFASTPLSELLREPFAALGSRDPELDASLIAHAVLGKMSDHLWEGTEPKPAEVRAIVDFCLRAVTADR